MFVAMPLLYHLRLLCIKGILPKFMYMHEMNRIRDRPELNPDESESLFRLEGKHVNAFGFSQYSNHLGECSKTNTFYVLLAHH